MSETRGRRLNAGRRLVVAWSSILALAAGCTSGTVVGSSGTVALPTISPSNPAARTTTTGSPVPVNPAGMALGPGVTATTLTLGVLENPASDGGFSAGLTLWQKSVNSSGGVCGRTVALATGSAGETAADTYRRLALQVVGFAAADAGSGPASVASLAGPDGLTVLTATGSSAELTGAGQVIVGATDDIRTINTLDYLRTSGRLTGGLTIGVVTDGSVDATNALAGAQWWAGRNHATLLTRPVADTAAWSGVQAVLVLAPPAAVRQALSTAAAPLPVIAGLGGFDPSGVPSDQAARVWISLTAPAFGSDHPIAAAVSKAFAESGAKSAGPELLDGYGVAATWERLLSRACSDRSLTRAGVARSLTVVGPASLDSLFGPSDPGLVVQSKLPATRVSSIAQAAPGAPGGMRPTVWLQAAANIADYRPPG